MSGPHLRLAVPSDLQPLVALEARAMHFPMSHRVREWFRDDHPSVRLEQIAVAEDEGQIVAAAALLPETLLYRGVPLASARWEAVATESSHRRQGLCRALFRLLEERSNADLILVEGLTWLYHRFGYYPAVRNHGGCNSGSRTALASSFPEPSDLAARPAMSEDAPFLSRLRRKATARYVLASPVTEAAWQHAIREDRSVVGPEGKGLNKWEEVRILEKAGVPVGYFFHDPWDIALLMDLEIVPGATTWREAGATAVRATGEFAKSGEVRVALPESHPLFAAYPQSFRQGSRAFSDWAVRIPDPVVFLNAIAPALESMLARSAMAGWSGELTISRIEDGVKVVFAAGKLRSIEPWMGETPHEARVRLMPGRFEVLVLGYRSVEQILQEDPDSAVADEEAEALLAALFPPGDSYVRPV